VTVLAVRIFGKKIYSPVVVLAVLPRSGREWLVLPFALALSVLLEELLFRSLLLGGFGTIAPAAALAVVWSILFGLMHLPQGVLGMIVAGALGLLLSALFLATASLVAPLAAHYVINLLQLSLASLDKSWMENYRRSAGDANASSHP
jgi:membrane protease YdiL (CAAX protease family)